MFDFWRRIKVSDPLDEEVGWSLPETPRQGPSLVIMGGRSESFTVTSQVFGSVSQIKTVKSFSVLIPESLKRFIGTQEQTVYLASSSTGVLKGPENKTAIYDNLIRCDMAVLVEDVSVSSESALVLRSSLASTSKFLLQGAALEVFAQDEQALLGMQGATVLVSVKQLQDLMTRAKCLLAVKQSFGLLELVRYLAEVSRQFEATIMVDHSAALVVASRGQVVSINQAQEDRRVGWQAAVCAQVAYVAGASVTDSFSAVVYGCQVALKEGV